MKTFYLVAGLALSVIFLVSPTPAQASAAVDGASVSVSVNKSGTAAFSAATTKGRLEYVSFKSTTLKVKSAAVIARLGQTVGSVSFVGGPSPLSVGLPTFTQSSNHGTITWWESADTVQSPLTAFAMSFRWGITETGPVAIRAVPDHVTGLTLSVTSPLITTSKNCAGTFSGSAYVVRHGAAPATVPFAGRCS
jgi:hypothetical protein